MSSKNVNILDRPLSKGKYEVSISAYALLFSEIVQYCQSRVFTVTELQDKLASFGEQIGIRIIDTLTIRERGFRRDTKLLNVLVFIRSNVWKTLFGREADKLEHANDDAGTYYIIEKESLVNHFISVPKDKGNLNCAAFVGGILEGILKGCGYPATVTVHWHKGTTFLIKFDDSVIARENMVSGHN